MGVGQWAMGSEGLKARARRERQRAPRASGGNGRPIALPLAMPHGPSNPGRSVLRYLARTMNIDAALPAPVRNAKRGYVITFSAVLIALMTLLALALLDLGPDLGNGPLFAYFLLMVATTIFWDRASKRALRRAAAHDHLLCPDCLYDLRTLDATGTCPECGRAYEHDAVRAQWIEAERRLKPGKTRPANDEPPA